MSLYLLINILIIIVPITFSFEKKLKFYRKIPSVFLSIIIVSTVYIIWDHAAAVRGDWSFNPRYILGINIFSLPVEEVLFFITVPYSCIFIYETIFYFVNEKEINVKKSYSFIVSALFIIAAFVFDEQLYTFNVLIFTGSLFLICGLLFISLLRSKNFWLTVLISFLPFLIVNYFFTSLPVVEYNAASIWGIRVFTIPLEDFFYSFSMVAFWLLVYLLSEQKIKTEFNYFE